MAARGKTVPVEKDLTETLPGEEISALDPVEVELELELAPPAEDDKPVEVTPEPKPAAAVEEDPVVAKLKADLAAAEGRERERAAELARVNGELQTTRSQVQTTQAGQIDAALEAANANAQALERDLADAYTQGDYAKVASLQRQMAKVETQISRLEEGKEALASAPSVAQRQTSADPVEQVIAANPSLPQTDRDWLRKHPDAVTDPEKFSLLQSTAAYATRKFGGQTTAYYKFIEQELGYAKSDPDLSPATPQVRKQPSYSAPVSREGSNGLGNEAPRKGSKVRLSPSQRQAAKDSGITDAEYAKNLIELVKSGQLPDTAVEYVN